MNLLAMGRIDDPSELNPGVPHALYWTIGLAVVIAVFAIYTIWKKQ